MNVRDMVAKTGDLVKRYSGHLWYVLVGVLALWSAYNLGLVLAHRGTHPLQEAAVFVPSTAVVSHSPTPTRQGTIDHSDPRVVASKTSSSKKYHHVWCSGAKRIKPQNQVWFPTAQTAVASGYVLAANCSE